MYRVCIAGELKPAGSLKELSGVIETQLHGQLIYIGEVKLEIREDPVKLSKDPQFEKNVMTLFSFGVHTNDLSTILIRVVLERRNPTGIITFHSTTSVQEMINPLDDFFTIFAQEADYLYHGELWVDRPSTLRTPDSGWEPILPL